MKQKQKRKTHKCLFFATLIIRLEEFLLEFTKLADICAKYHVLIIADEIYGDLIIRVQTFIPIAKATGKQEGIITFTAINKIFNTAGLHCTNAIIPEPDLRKKFSSTLGMQFPSPLTIPH